MVAISLKEFTPKEGMRLELLVSGEVLTGSIASLEWKRLVSGRKGNTLSVIISIRNDDALAPRAIETFSLNSYPSTAVPVEKYEFDWETVGFHFFDSYFSEGIQYGEDDHVV